MKNNKIPLPQSLVLAACLGTVIPLSVAHAQVINPSTTPIAGALVGDLGVAQSSPEASTGIAIENLCPQLVVRENRGQNSAIQSDLRFRCTDLIVDNNQDSNLRQVVAEEMATQETEVVELSNNQLGKVAARMVNLRAGLQAGEAQASVFNAQSGVIAFQFNDQNLGGGAGDSIADSGKLGLFINGEISTGDKDETANEAGFDIDASAVTLGLDYRINSSGFLGVALGINRSDSEMDNNGGEIESDGVSLSVYGTQNLDNDLFIDGTLGLGQYDYDTARNLNYIADGTAVNQRALASTEADVVFASIGVGRDSAYKRSEGMRLTYTGRLNYLNADVDGFTETMSNQNAPGFGMNLEVDDQEIESLTSVLSAQLARAINTRSGVIIPFGAFSYIHEFEDDPRVILARFANDPFSADFDQQNGVFPTGANATSNGRPVPTIISITTDSPDTDYFQIAGGVSGILPNGKNWFVSLSSTLGLDDTSYYSVTAGYRGEF